eukprot:4364544-Amphidinium_carterae.1
MAGLQDTQLSVGTLIRYAAQYPQPDLPDDHALLVLFEAKKEHFRHSVYMLTSIEAIDGERTEDATVLGVNLTRPALSRWVPTQTLTTISGGSLLDEDVAGWRAQGLNISIGLGGPVKPKKLGPALLVDSRLPGGYLLGSPLELQHRGLALAADKSGEPSPPELRLFLGHARWTMKQLLAEVARGSWATVPGQAQQQDVRDESRRRLWRSLEDENRLQWAPPNPIAAEYQSRIST